MPLLAGRPQIKLLALEARLSLVATLIRQILRMISI
jgi:hypothetical protein